MGPGRKEIRDFHPVYPGHPFYGMDYLRFIGIGRFFCGVRLSSEAGTAYRPGISFADQKPTRKTLRFWFNSTSQPFVFMQLSTSKKAQTIR